MGGNMYQFKRLKILVRPEPPAEYKTRMEARIAWNTGKPFLLVGPEGETRSITSKWANDPLNKIGEVTVQFDGNRQAIVIKIPPLTPEQKQELLAKTAS